MSASTHFKQGQRERGISDESLPEAIELAEEKIMTEQGGERYTHKGIVHITTMDNVGITAFRIQDRADAVHVPPP